MFCNAGQNPPLIYGSDGLRRIESGGMPVHIAGQLRRDTWGGRNRIHLAIEDGVAIGGR